MGKLDTECWDQFKCNQISDNKVLSGNTRAAGIVAFAAADIKVKGAWISGHAAGSNVFLEGNGISAEIEGNIFTANGGSSAEGNTNLFRFSSSSGNIILAHNTFVGNSINTNLIKVTSNPNLLVYANIFKEDNNVDIFESTGNSANSIFDCLIVHENQSFTGSSIFMADPDFVDQANGDFHLNPSSPAIDLCDDMIYSASTKDIDDQDRGWDDVFADDELGPYDAGADEFYPATTADLSANKLLLTPPPYAINEAITYQIIVSNNGPDDATNIYIEDTAVGMTIDSVQSSSCSSFPCVISSLANGLTEIIAVQATLRDTVGVFDNSVTIYSEDYDPLTNDNTDNTGNGGMAVIDYADMAVQLELLTPGPYHSGQILSYQTNIVNNGPDSARNVMISSSGLNTQILTSRQFFGQPCQSLPCDIADFPSANTIDLTLTVQIVQGGSFSFGVKALSDSTDDDPNNNEVILNAVAGNSGDLSVSSSLVTPGDLYTGSAVEITIDVINNGPELVVANLANSLNNLQLVSISGSGCNSVPCGLGVIQNGESKTVTVMATIISSGAFSLDSSISTSSFDPDLSNNASTTNGVALAAVDLSADLVMVTQGDYYMDQQIEAVITIRNHGPDRSDRVDFVTGGDAITIDSVSGPFCDTATCLMPGLNSGESHVVSMLATITGENTFLIGAVVDNSVFDLVSENNLSEFVGTVSVNPDIIFEDSFE